MSETFLEKLLQIQTERKSRVCVGMDPDIDKLPGRIYDSAPSAGDIPGRILEFSTKILEAVAKSANIIKPNQAFWAAHGAEDQLATFIDRVHDHGLLVILDAKRGDIGNSAKWYAIECFERYGADAVTVNAYLGSDTLAPWLAHGPEKAIFVLCHTSNPGAAEFQEQKLKSGNPLFIDLAKKVTALQTPETACVGLVMGATFPEQIKMLTDAGVLSVSPLLIPGIGMQGGNLEATLRNACRFPFVVNSSSGIIHSSQSSDCFLVAGEKSEELRKGINDGLPKG